jgi:hypothetical protein
MKCRGAIPVLLLAVAGAGAADDALPIRITVHGWEDELLEMYHYTELALNVGLTEEDFDVDNDSYLFKFGTRAEL